MSSAMPMQAMQEARLLAQAVTIDDFQLLNKLGEGGCGSVWRCRFLRTGEILAIKIIDKSKVVSAGSVDRLLAEQQIMSLLPPCRFTIKLHFTFQSPTQVYFVLDIADGGDFMQLLHAQPDNRMPETTIQFYGAELVLALAHIHEHRVAFRDLKPENVLVSADGHLSVADFGLAVQGRGAEHHRSGSKSLCGTPEYMAPEVILERGHGKSVDLWCFGVMLFEMSQGRLPWSEQQRDGTAEMFIAAVSATPNFAAPITPALRSLIVALLAKEPNARLGCDDIGELQAHPFFFGVDWEERAAHAVDAPLRPAPGATHGVGQAELLERLTDNFESFVSPERGPGSASGTPTPASQLRHLATVGEERHLATVGEESHLAEDFNLAASKCELVLSVRVKDGVVEECPPALAQQLGGEVVNAPVSAVAATEADRSALAKIIKRAALERDTVSHAQIRINTDGTPTTLAQCVGPAAQEHLVLLKLTSSTQHA
eukprot:g4766.t1